MQKPRMPRMDICTMQKRRPTKKKKVYQRVSEWTMPKWPRRKGRTKETGDSVSVCIGLCGTRNLKDATPTIGPTLRIILLLVPQVNKIDFDWWPTRLQIQTQTRRMRRAMPLTGPLIRHGAMIFGTACCLRIRRCGLGTWNRFGK